MSRTRRNILDTESMLERLTDVLYEHGRQGVTHFRRSPDQARADAEQLRRISMTLHRWHELECGDGNGHIERGRMRTFIPEQGKPVRQFESDENGAPYFANHNQLRPTYHKMPDREAGALERLAAVMARYPSLTSYVQGDPRGCALYILRPGDVPAGGDVSAYYSRGLAVHQ